MSRVPFKAVGSKQEDSPSHPIKNLERGDFPWQTAKPAKEAYVHLDLGKRWKIDGIEVTNNGASFIEVAVGTSLGSIGEILLPESTLRSMADVKSDTGATSSRKFTPAQFSPRCRGEKWQFVQVKLTQKFNPLCCIGLSQIKFISSDGSDGGSMPSMPSFSSPIRNSALAMTVPQMDEIESDDDEPPPQRRMRDLAAIRAKAASESERTKREDEILASSSTAPKPRTGPPPAPAFSQDPTDSPPPPARRAMPPSVAAKPKPKPKKTSPLLDSDSDEAPPPRVIRRSVPTPTSPSPAPKAAAPAATPRSPVPAPRGGGAPPPGSPRAGGARPLTGVLFVISGFVDPERSKIRSQGTLLGARYARDWEEGKTTHLISAFVNTPKSRKVKAGHIVSPQWLTDCHLQKKRMPEGDYPVKDPGTGGGGGGGGGRGGGRGRGGGGAPKKTGYDVDDFSDEDSFASESDSDSDSDFEEPPAKRARTGPAPGAKKEDAIPEFMKARFAKAAAAGAAKAPGGPRSAGAADPPSDPTESVPDSVILDDAKKLKALYTGRNADPIEGIKKIVDTVRGMLDKFGADMLGADFRRQWPFKDVIPLFVTEIEASCPAKEDKMFDPPGEAQVRTDKAKAALPHWQRRYLAALGAAPAATAPSGAPARAGSPRARSPSPARKPPPPAPVVRGDEPAEDGDSDDTQPM